MWLPAARRGFLALLAPLLGSVGAGRLHSRPCPTFGQGCLLCGLTSQTRCPPPSARHLGRGQPCLTRGSPLHRLALREPSGSQANLHLSLAGNAHCQDRGMFSFLKPLVPALPPRPPRSPGLSLVHGEGCRPHGLPVVAARPVSSRSGSQGLPPGPLGLRLGADSRPWVSAVPVPGEGSAAFSVPWASRVGRSPLSVP